MNFKSSFRCFSLIKSSSVFSICILIFLPVITLLLTGTFPPSSEDESFESCFRFRLSFRSFFSLRLFLFLDLCFLVLCLLCLCFLRERLRLLLSSELESSSLELLLSELGDLDRRRRLLCFLSRRRECSRELSSLSSFLSFLSPLPTAMSLLLLLSLGTFSMYPISLLLLILLMILLSLEVRGAKVYAVCTTVLRVHW